MENLIHLVRYMSIKADLDRVGINGFPKSHGSINTDDPWSQNTDSNGILREAAPNLDVYQVELWDPIRNKCLLGRGKSTGRHYSLIGEKTFMMISLRC